MDTQQEHVLQAVILADPFELQARYGPLIRGGGKGGEGCENALPWCLLPFLNSPLIAWTLESLSASNVKTAFIVLRDGARELQDWLETSNFVSPTASMKIRIRSTQAYTEGDVMREVDGFGITGNWLLVKAGYIGNLNLEQAVNDFTVKRKKDPGLLMDCVLAPRSRALTPKISTYVMSPSLQLLHFHQNPRLPARHRLNFPLPLFETAHELMIRTDLESVGVYVCNMEVPALFVENFDYPNLRPDFINGILTSDLLGKSICCTIIGNSTSRLGTSSIRAQPWAAAVEDLASYAQINKAVISRWSYPLTLDEGIPGSNERYEQRRGRLYVGKNLTLASSCIIGPAAVVGDMSVIGEHSKVSHSVLGAHCRIGTNVNIVNSFIMQGACIEDDCNISDSVVSMGARVQAYTELKAGCLVGPGVIVGEKAILKAQRLSTEPWGQARGMTNGKSAEGPGSISEGHIWPSEEQALAEEQDSDDEDAEDPRNLRFAKLANDTEIGHIFSTSSVSTLSRTSSSSSLASSASDASSHLSALSEPPAIMGIGALNLSEDSEDLAFQRECVSSLDRSFAERHTIDNTAIELKTLRMASNVPLKRVIGVVVPYLCKHVKVESSDSAGEVATKVNEAVTRWGPLVKSLTSGQQVEMVETLLALQQHCATESVHPRLFAAFLQAYYNDDVVTEEAAISWVKNPASRNVEGETGKKLWQLGAAFVKVLMEAEDESEEEENSD